MPSKIVVKVASPVRSAPLPSSPAEVEVETQPTKRQAGPSTLTTVPPPQPEPPQAQPSSAVNTATSTDNTLSTETLSYLTAWTTLPRHASTLIRNSLPSEQQMNQILVDTGVTDKASLIRWFVGRREEYWRGRVERAAAAEKTTAAAQGEANVVAMGTSGTTANVGAATANAAAANNANNNSMWQHRFPSIAKNSPEYAAYLNLLASSGVSTVPTPAPPQSGTTTAAATAGTAVGVDVGGAFPSMPVGGLNPMMAAALGGPGVGGQGGGGLYGALSQRYNIAIAQAAAAAARQQHREVVFRQAAQQQRAATAAAAMMGMSKAVEGQIIVGDSKLLPTATTGSVGESRDAASIGSRQASSPLQSREPAPSFSSLPSNKTLTNKSVTNQEQEKSSALASSSLNEASTTLKRKQSSSSTMMASLPPKKRVAIMKNSVGNEERETVVI